MPMQHDQAVQNVELIRAERVATFWAGPNLAMESISNCPPGWTIADAMVGTSDPGTLMDSAPNDADRLHCLSLIEGFKKFVLDDPEIVALSKPVVAANKGHAAVFRDGQAPGPDVHFYWPLDST